MIDSLISIPSLWETLSISDKPVFLYGMGNGADKVLQTCRSKGISVEGIFASDEYVRGHDFAGYRVMRYCEVAANYGSDIVILPCFAAHTDELIGRMVELSRLHTLYVPDVPVYGGGLFDSEFVSTNFDRIEQTYDILADNASRQLYIDVLKFKLTGELSLLGRITTDKKDAYRLLNLTPHEVYADLGAYTGDTVEEVLAYSHGFAGIYALEPDKRNYRRLQAAIERLGLSDIAHTYNIGAWDKRSQKAFEGKSGRGAGIAGAGNEAIDLDSLDNVLGGAYVSLIKMDVEGSDLMALNGCRNTIQAYHPKLILSLYHRNEDVFAIPLKVRQLYPDYKLYLGRHKYIPAWDFNLYCI